MTKISTVSSSINSSIQWRGASGMPIPPIAAIQAAAVALGTAPLRAEDLRRTTDELTRLINVIAPELQFSVDSSSGRTVMKLADGATREILFQFPSETALRVSRGIERFQKGLLANHAA